MAVATRMTWALFLASTAALADEPVRTDLHVHFSMKEAIKPFFRGESGRGPEAQSPNTLLRNQVDTAELARAGVRVAVASVWPPTPIRPGRSPRDEALHQLDGLRAFAERHPDVRLVHSAAEASEALAHDQLALIPAVEGGEGIHSVEDLDLYFAAGARLMTVVHMADSDLGGAANGQLSHLVGLSSQPNPQGLTELGKAVVRRMAQLGMVIDAAHASDATARDILAIAEPEGVPVLYSHGASRELHPMERNLPDWLAQRVAKTGGLVGVTLFRDFLEDVPAPQRWAGYQNRSCDDVIAHWKHFAGLVGADSVVLGSDWNGMVVRSEPGGACPNGLRNTADLPALYAGLAQHGVPAASLDGGGRQMVRVLELAESKADPAERARASRLSLPRSGPFDVAL